MRMALLAITVFLTVGMGFEYLIGLISRGTDPQEAAQSTERFMGALMDGEAIPERDMPAGQVQQRPDSPEDCTAARMAAPMAQPSMTGTVTKVVDGDTLRVTVEGISMPIRLWGIDAPEMNQALGGRAQSKLASMTPVNSVVMIHPMSIDQYGRVVGTVGQDRDWAINFQMVAYGWAYHYREFSARNNSCLAEAESIARQRQNGVWQNGPEGQTRPWDYRKQSKALRKADPI